MAYTTIDKPTDYFDSVLYTGNGAANRDISGLDFQPDWVWIKDRANPGTTWHHVFDSSRGVNKPLNTNVDNAQGSVTTFPAFNSDGFRVNAGNLNTNTQTNVAWCWKANGGTTSSLSGGDIGITTTSQANTTAKFSINTYEGTGSQSAIGHGLGVAPDFIIIKNRDQDDSWFVWHQTLNNNQGLELDTNVAVVTSTAFMGNEAPTTTTIGVGTGSDTNADNENYVCYAFSEVQGFSKFGSYTGNGNADGPFIYTGFKPAWVMIKETGATGSWHMFDNKRKVKIISSFIIFFSISIKFHATANFALQN